MNYVNYVNHTLYTPNLYHRRFEQDLPVHDNEPQWENQAKRIALAALPYISLYRPAASILSIGMGSFRLIHHLSAAFTSEEARDWKAVFLELFQVALAVLSVASAIFNFSIGLAITTSIETMQGLLTLGYLLSQGEFAKAFEETLQTLGSAVYLGFMLSGALELMLAFTLLQMVSGVFQAHGDFANGRYLEAASKLGMGFVRLHQATGYIQQIERRNSLLKLQKYADFLNRALKGREVRYLLENPLSEFKDAERAILDETDFGAYFHGFGQELVKGANLAFRTKVVNGKEITELDFKVNHVFRDKIQGVIQDFSKLKPQEMKEILELTHSHAKEIRIDKNQLIPLGEDTMGPATKITLEGLGSIFIGSSSELPNMYDRVVIHMDHQKTIYDFHELMAFVDIDQALHTSTQKEMDRLKMGHLFRIFYPQEATPLERSKEFFTLSLEELKQKMIEKAPEMERIFEDYFAKMTPEEILPGKMRYRVNGLAEKAYEMGARGLTAAVTGVYGDEELFSRIAAMLKMGMLSTETRAQGNINVGGLGGDVDFYSGGADSVYTQMVTEKNCRENMGFYELHYNGRARFLISLDALETGTYQYLSDSFGNRQLSPSWWGEDYATRPGILEFVDELQHVEEDEGSWWWNNPYGGHEVMLKERLDPSFFTGIAVNNAETRDDLIAYLKGQDLGTIRGVAVEQFVRVADTFSEDLFT